jgi:RNA polymerase sigma factor (sigma-70 family)
MVRPYYYRKMTATDTSSLLREYLANRSETAFATIVERHLNLVYSTALRQTGNSSLAEEVCQKVFVLLAGKAASLRDEQLLSGWLYRSTCKVASEALRSERRRQIREHKAMEALQESNSPEPQIIALLDEAMAALSEMERNAILLRYFENKPLREVGAALGVSEDTAQKRVTRAVERLRSWFGRRGTNASNAALAAILSASAAQTAPAGLAASVLSSATLAATAASSITIITTNLMAMLNLKTGLMTATFLALSGALVVQQRELGTLRQEQANAPFPAPPPVMSDPSDATAELERLRRDVAELHRLRGEVGELRREKAESAKLRQEFDRLRARVANQQQKPPQEPEDNDPVKQYGIRRMNQARGWTVAFMHFAEKNNGLLPTTFAEAETLFPNLNQDTSANSAPLLPEAESFELVHKGKFSDILEPPSTIVLREKKAWQNPKGGWSRTYGFADGHSEIHSSPNGDFEQWEKTRMALNTK